MITTTLQQERLNGLHVMSMGISVFTAGHVFLTRKWENCRWVFRAHSKHLFLLFGKKASPCVILRLCENYIRMCKWMRVKVYWKKDHFDSVVLYVEQILRNLTHPTLFVFKCVTDDEIKGRGGLSRDQNIIIETGGWHQSNRPANKNTSPIATRLTKTMKQHLRTPSVR